MKDLRINSLADVLVNYSCQVQKGEKVLIEAVGIDYMLVNAIIEKVYEAGGFPFVELVDQRVNSALFMGTNKEHCQMLAKYDAYRMQDMDCYIGIRGGNNASELSSVPKDNILTYNTYYSNPVHSELRVNGTKWVVLRYPTEGMAQKASMSTDAFEDFYFYVCTLDYRKMDKAMDNLCALIEKTDKVRIVAKDTDVTFSIKGIGAVKCSGRRNIPDGEVYSAPVKNSVNGYITYNTSSVQSGTRFENIRLEFKDGKIVKATANDTEAINKVFDIDDGARYIGEFALGVNPYITKPMGDILFDEKIAGSIHFTPGSCYKRASNGNDSALHWDLVLIQTPEYGGGEIYFDDVLIRKDGMFTLEELKCLNPENLK